MASWCDTPEAPTERRPTMTTPDRLTFAVYPADMGDGFDAFLIDVPTLDGDLDRAARRAYFSTMAHLAPRGVDVDDFAVCVWADGRPGPLVGPGGVVR